MHTPVAFVRAPGQDMAGTVGAGSSPAELPGRLWTVIGDWLRGGPGQAQPVPGDFLFHMLSQVMPQVPAVGDLHRFRHSGAGALRIGPGPVAADDLRAGVLTQPSGEGSRLPVRQQVNGTAGAAAGQDRAVDLAFAQREVIHPQHRWCTGRSAGGQQHHLSGAGPSCSPPRPGQRRA